MCLHTNRSLSSLLASESLSLTLPGKSNLSFVLREGEPSHGYQPTLTIQVAVELGSSHIHVNKAPQLGERDPKVGN